MHKTTEHHEVMTSLESLVVMDFDAGTVFSGQPSGKLAKGYVINSPFTPVIDTSYILYEQNWDIVA